jgi:hypothetical protein
MEKKIAGAGGEVIDINLKKGAWKLCKENGII